MNHGIEKNVLTIINERYQAARVTLVVLRHGVTAGGAPTLVYQIVPGGTLLRVIIVATQSHATNITN